MGAVLRRALRVTAGALLLIERYDVVVEAHLVLIERYDGFHNEAPLHFLGIFDGPCRRECHLALALKSPWPVAVGRSMGPPRGLKAPPVVNLRRLVAPLCVAQRDVAVYRCFLFSC